MLAPPPTEWAVRDGIHLAYQVAGSGPDLVFVAGSVSMSLAWDDARSSRALRRMASYSRLVTFDQRGMGFSDVFDSSSVPTVEDLMLDLEAVIAAAGVTDPVLFGMHNGAAVAAAYAATHPVRRLILCNGWARIGRADDYPIGLPDPILDRLGQQYEQEWGRGTITSSFARGAPGSPADRTEMASTSRSQAVVLFRLNRELDVRHYLPAITAPTLVLHMEDDVMVPPVFGRYFATSIPGARLVLLPGADHLFLRNASTPVLDEVELFLTGSLNRYNDSFHAGILFTDIVDSTPMAAKLGDERWSTLIDEHNTRMQAVIRGHDGYEVKSTGDGFLVAFDDPVAAIGCALASMEAVRDLGLELRAGVHVGEVSRMGSKDLAGLTVHFAQRLCGRAGGGQVLVSEAVRAECVLTELTFESHGKDELKGIPGVWEVFEASL